MRHYSRLRSGLNIESDILHQIVFHNNDYNNNSDNGHNQTLHTNNLINK